MNKKKHTAKEILALYIEPERATVFKMIKARHKFKTVADAAWALLLYAEKNGFHSYMDESAPSTRR